MGSKLTDMEVDAPNQNTSNGSSLKRCSSAPMINEINVKMNNLPSPTPIRDTVPQSAFVPRPRRFSASFSPIPGSPNGIPRLTPRVNQLRQEESVDVSNIREVAHERQVHSAMQMSQSWEDLRLVSDTSISCKNTAIKDTKMTPLNISLPMCALSCSSPSPTRPGFNRQCFSPSISMSWKNTMSPSPTRKSFTTRRSLSPIAMRPSQLGPVKRKFELEDEKNDSYLSPPIKKVMMFHPVERGGLLITQNTTSSPLPGSLSSVGTPESLSSADSPCSAFRSIDSPSPGRLLGSNDEPMVEERSTNNNNNNNGTGTGQAAIVESVEQN